MAAEYGFLVTEYGVGVKTINVTDRGAAFGVADSSNLSILDILFAVNTMSHDSLLYDTDRNGELSKFEIDLRKLAFSLFTEIKSLGDF